MFDIGFSELLVIGVVALLVLGPERLPKVARTAGHIVGRLQRYMASVKEDMEREGHLRDLQDMRAQFESSKREVEQSVNSVQQNVSAEIASEAESLTQTIHAPAAEAPVSGVDVATGEASLAVAGGAGEKQDSEKNKAD